MLAKLLLVGVILTSPPQRLPCLTTINARSEIRWTVDFIIPWLDSALQSLELLYLQSPEIAGFA